MKDPPDSLPAEAPPLFAPARLDDVFGSLPFAGGPKTLDEMDAGVIAEAKRRARD